MRIEHCRGAAFLLIVLCCAAAHDARAAFPVRPDDGALVDGRHAVFRFGLDPGERRAKVVFVDDQARGAYNPDSRAWDNGTRLESPWAIDGVIRWNMRVFPGFYVWRLCTFGDATDPDEECDLQPELRLVRVSEGILRPCRGEFAGGFFRNLAAHRASCGTAATLVRKWVKRSHFGERRPPKSLRIGRWACRLRIVETDENPYGRVTCTRGRRVVRFYGVS